MGTHLRIHKVTLKTGITRTKEFEKKGLAQYATNIGAKCGHGCLYCSTGAMLRAHGIFKKVHENPYAVGYAIVDPDTPVRVAGRARRARKRGLIQLCTTVDAWSPEAQEYNLGRKCLEAILKESGWTVRILTKNAAVEQEFDFLEDYKDRILVGLSLTATKDKAKIMSIVEPNASPISERMRVLHEARKRGLRTYGMLCPLLPGIADSPDQIDKLVEFLLDKCYVEEIFVEAVNPRGKGLILTEEALRSAGYDAEADAVSAIRHHKEWSAYCRELLESVQDSLRARNSLDKLRYLLYPENLTPADKQWIKHHSEGVKWLTKKKAGKKKAGEKEAA
jgi:DNA repair photolyase